jgi:hypothetical protein
MGNSDDLAQMVVAGIMLLFITLAVVVITSPLHFLWAGEIFLGLLWLPYGLVLRWVLSERRKGRR